MPLERSPEHSQASVLPSGGNEQICSICEEKLSEGQECLIISECNHAFHRKCIETFLSQSSQCPICKRPCSLSELKTINVQDNLQPKRGRKYTVRDKPRGALAKRPNTRSHIANLSNEFQTHLVDLNNESVNQNLDQAQNLTPQRNQPTLNNTQSSPVNRSNTPFRNEVDRNHINFDLNYFNNMIEKQVSRMLQNLNLQSVSQNILNNHYTQSIPLQPECTSQNYPSTSPQCSRYRHSPNNSSFDESAAIRSDKITSIIQNWNIKFDGSSKGISVDEFLYRIRSLTEENFNNDFSVICKNLHILLAGRARDWYWRYHKQVDTVEWKEFCEALKYQYKDFRSNFDIQEEIRNRKMKPNENFESFYESVCSMLDKLSSPIPESDLVEILLRNLRPEIRHELLYIPVYSIAHLRKLVQRREHLLDSDYFRKSINKFTPNFVARRQVAELDGSSESESKDVDIDLEMSVDAIQKSKADSKCWNCNQPGHHWEDCLESRNIFCYGCGMPNMYKPQCPKCANRNITISKNFPQKMLP